MTTKLEKSTEARVNYEEILKSLDNIRDAAIADAATIRKVAEINAEEIYKMTVESASAIYTTATNEEEKESAQAILDMALASAEEVRMIALKSALVAHGTTVTSIKQNYIMEEKAAWDDYRKIVTDLNKFLF